MGKFLEKCKHFFCNLELGGMGEVSLQHGKLLEALSGVFILGEEKLLQCVSLKDCNKSILTNPDALALLNSLSLSTWASLPPFPTEYLGLANQCSMMSQHLGQSAFVASLGSLGSLSEIELSQRVFINSAWLATVAL